MDDHFFNMRKDNFDEENAGSMVKGSDALSRSADDDLQHTQKKRKVEQGPEMNSLEVYKKFATEEAILCPFEVCRCCVLHVALISFPGVGWTACLHCPFTRCCATGYSRVSQLRPHIPHWLQGSSLLP